MLRNILQDKIFRKKIGDQAIQFDLKCLSVIRMHTQIKRRMCCKSNNIRTAKRICRTFLLIKGRKK